MARDNHVDTLDVQVAHNTAEKTCPVKLTPLSPHAKLMQLAATLQGHHGAGGGLGNQGVTGQPQGQGNTGVATTGGTGGGQHGVSGELLPPNSWRSLPAGQQTTHIQLYLAGSYETHRHKDDLDEKGEYRST